MASLIAVVLLLSSFIMISSEGDVNGQVTFHSPIRIMGVMEVGTNGISSGSGTSDDPFILEGVVVNSSVTDGIVIENVTQHLVIRNCVVVYGMRNYVSGIKVRNSTNITISSCQVYQTRTGINISSSGRISLWDNYVASTHTGYLLNINDSMMVNCSAEWNGYYGMRFHDSNNNQIVDSSSSNNCGVLGVASGLTMLNSSGNTIKECSFDLNYGEGVSLLYGSDDNYLSGCSMGWNVNGLYVIGSELNRVEFCSFRSNTNGISLSNATFTHIDNCKLRSNFKGVHLYRSQYNRLFGSILESNDEGVSIFSSPNNRIIGNKISNGSSYGVIIGNRVGVEERSNGNMVWENWFIGNNRGFVQARDQGDGTIWVGDNRGNLWSDLPGPDNDTDGIVDIPYVLHGGSSQDESPIAHEVGAVEEGPGEMGYSDGVDEGSKPWLVWTALIILFAAVIVFLAPMVIRRR
ncbi:MAG: right-handed parallel beta-helix repeat-containing protein [Thermoplasmata archaeon]|nr:right-handed parallel beta-helix repeat-containing protein [Thermoplasmata archaeon]